MGDRTRGRQMNLHRNWRAPRKNYTSQDVIVRKDKNRKLPARSANRLRLSERSQTVVIHWRKCHA